MPVMSDGDRIIAWKRWMRENKESCPFTKVELKAAIDYTDGWIDANQPDYVSGLPVAFGGTNSTTEQKVRLFLYVLKRRFEVGA